VEQTALRTRRRHSTPLLELILTALELVPIHLQQTALIKTNCSELLRGNLVVWAVALSRQRAFYSTRIPLVLFSMVFYLNRAQLFIYKVEFFAFAWNGPPFVAKRGVAQVT